MQELHYEGIAVWTESVIARAALDYDRALSDRGLRVSTHFPATGCHGGRVETVVVLGANGTLRSVGADVDDEGPVDDPAARRLRGELASLEDSHATAADVRGTAGSGRNRDSAGPSR